MNQREQLFPQPDFIRPYEDFRAFRGLRIGVTGQRGVLGRILVSRLQAQGLEVRAFGGDITDERALADWFPREGFDLFFHFAAIVPVTAVAADPQRAQEVNAGGALRVAQHARRANPQGWLFLASTSHVYKASPAQAPRALEVGRDEGPVSPYGRTKLAGEELCRGELDAAGAHYCIGRIFSFSHRTQQEPYLVPTLGHAIAALAEGAALPVFNADSLRDISDAETMIDAVFHLAERRWQGTLNIGAGAGWSVGAIAQHIARRLGKTIRVEPQPAGVPDALIADVAPLRRALA